MKSIRLSVSILCVCFVSVAWCQQPVGHTNWSQYRFDASHTGFNPYEKVLNASNVGALHLKWRHYTGSFSLVEDGPAVVNGVVYVGSEPNKVYAFGVKKARK
jgi:glucose dehydrogenase